MPVKETCRHCGKPVPSRRRDTGFCTLRCETSQRLADWLSAKEEKNYSEEADAQG